MKELEKKDKILKKADLLIIAAIIITAIIIFIFFHSSSSGTVAKVYRGGKQIAVLNLANDTVYDVKNHGNTVNTVEVKNGYVFMKSASCGNQICVHHKKISKKGQSIICLPNRVEVVIEGKKGGSGIDSVAG